MKLLALVVIVKLSVAVIIDCDYKDDSDGRYTCFVSGDLETDEIDNFISEINGNHIYGRASDDVEHFYVTNKSVEYFPGGLSNYLPNLKAITLKNSKLKYIFKDDLVGLSKLKHFEVCGNKIRTLSPSLFEDNPDLEEIHFESNEISSISDDLLDYNDAKLKVVHFFGNECIEKDLDVPSPSATDIKKMIQEKCPLTRKKIVEIVDKQLEKLKNRINFLQDQLNVSKTKALEAAPSSIERERENENIEKLTFEKENLYMKVNVATLSLEEKNIEIKNLTKENENLQATLTVSIANGIKIKALNDKLKSEAKARYLEIESLSKELKETIKERENVEKLSKNQISSLRSVNYELKKQITFSSANVAHYESLKARYVKDVPKKKPKINLL